MNLSSIYFGDTQLYIKKREQEESAEQSLQPDSAIVTVFASRIAARCSAKAAPIDALPVKRMFEGRRLRVARKKQPAES